MEENDNSITVTDISDATQIIKAAIERGVFKAEEMSGIARVFDKFSHFMSEQQALAQAQAQAQADKSTQTYTQHETHAHAQAHAQNKHDNLSCTSEKTASANTPLSSEGE